MVFCTKFSRVFFGRMDFLNQNRNPDFFWETDKLSIFFEIIWKVEQIPEILSPIALKSDKNSRFYGQMKINTFSWIWAKIS